MEITNVKINNYGNLKNREFEFRNGINIIYGKNEAGKSTMINYLNNILYGISKNKNGKEISDYEKYLPWTGEEFSGKITYKLDNENKLEIFRDFRKNKLQIINELGEDISGNFEIDKTRNNNFFFSQTNVNQELFKSTFMSFQKEVKVDKDKQSEILQKISNMIETGDELVSYKRAIDNISKRQNEEVGTRKN